MPMRALLIGVFLAIACGPVTPGTSSPPPAVGPAPVASPPAVGPAPVASPPVPMPTRPAPIPGPGTGTHTDGEACLAAGECQSGICEGEGCAEAQPGHCVNAQRGCTRDRHAFCGCDGHTFFTSGSCPARRYSARQACPAP